MGLVRRGETAVTVYDHLNRDAGEEGEGVQRPDALYDSTVVEQHVKFNRSIAGRDWRGIENARQIARPCPEHGDRAAKRDCTQRMNFQECASDAQLAGGPAHRSG